MLRIHLRREAAEELSKIAPEFGYPLWEIIHRQWAKNPPCDPNQRLSSPHAYHVAIEVNNVTFSVSFICPYEGQCPCEGDGAHCPYNGDRPLRVVGFCSPLPIYHYDGERQGIPWLIPDD